jgi:5'-phosphate synthase pdxT subunit
MKKVGVLALQGGFAAHEKKLDKLDLHPVEVRYAEQLKELDGLVFPGGESSTMLKLLRQFGLWKPVDEFVKSGKPVLATCAGFILAAREVINPEQESFGWIDVKLERNGFGRQLDSFEATADDGKTPLVFIRAPRVRDLGSSAEVILTLNDEPVMVRQNNVFGATFHPELTASDSIHKSIFS